MHIPYQLPIVSFPPTPYFMVISNRNDMMHSATHLSYSLLASYRRTTKKKGKQKEEREEKSIGGWDEINSSYS